MASQKSLSRRSLLGGIGTVGLSTSLSGCALLGGSAPEDGQANAKSQEDVGSGPVKIAFITFTSGAASIFGKPSVNAAKLLVDDINSNGGILGERKIEAQYIDEAAGTDQMVSTVRRLKTKEDVDAIIGFVSSSDALAVAPIVNELEQLTLIYDAGTHQLFEEESYEYVFRTSGHLAVDAVGAARYISRHMPEVERVAGINQDYAFGHDNMKIFKAALQKLRPDIEIVAERFPKLLANDHSTHISKLKEANPDLVFSSFWGGDTVTFTKQAQSRGLFEETEILFGGAEHELQDMGKDMPEGVITGARGPHAFNYNQSNPLQKRFVEAYNDRFDSYPIYPSYHMWQAIQFYVGAIEKAYNITGSYPTQEQIASALEGSAIQTPGGTVAMPNHQAKEPAFFGRTTYKDEYDFAVIEDAQLIPASYVNPPDGMKTMDWISNFE
ncbi:ABC transporter substrate-binding protein [Haloarchaeobius sp. DYHT-AS-18]|uniref:ABC transporter substrate-binding protein n=1 Tax=Haloarchaeobius sp. DYHT-AS-18 TaxID=3446117 RepID=UPI003EB76C1A